MQWREAATLILASRIPCGNTAVSNSNKDKFNILTLKRSNTAKFMPNAVVFPGGVVDKTDFSGDWVPLLTKHNPQLPNPKPFWNPSIPKPMIYEKKHSFEDISRHIAFRITALRETFEETGLLLLSDGSIQSLDMSWRQRVHENPREFLTMCKEFDICPNIWSLYEWSDWLTPLHLKTKSRFDTMFYIASTDIANHRASSDGDQEVTEVQFKTPFEALEQHLQGEIWLAPPQFYEFARLATYPSISSLSSFSEKRALNHVTATWFPVMVSCSDGSIALYPEDEAYPKNPDIFGTSGGPKLIDAQNQTIEEYSNQFSLNENEGRRNRMEFKGQNSKSPCRIISNIKDPSGHVSPLYYG